MKLFCKILFRTVELDILVMCRGKIRHDIWPNFRGIWLNWTNLCNYWDDLRQKLPRLEWFDEIPLKLCQISSRDFFQPITSI